MITIRRMYAALFCVLLFVPAFSCKKAEEARPEEAAPSVTYEMSVEKAAGMKGDIGSALDSRKAEKAVDEAAVEEEMKADDGRGIQGHFIAPMDMAKERLLEYRVELTYETKNILASRRALLGVVAKYGFVKASSAELDESTAMVASDVMVKSEKLYDALLDLDGVGTLLAETITVTDHTEDMALQNLKGKREQIRIARKGIASGQATAASKNWADIENSLALSEDEFDASEHRKWSIRDKVAWATVRVNLNGPEQLGRVQVPKYVNALIDLTTGLLYLFYALIYVAPFALIAGLIIWKRKQIIGIFRKKKE